MTTPHVRTRPSGCIVRHFVKDLSYNRVEGEHPNGPDQRNEVTLDMARQLVERLPGTGMDFEHSMLAEREYMNSPKLRNAAVKASTICHVTRAWIKDDRELWVEFDLDQSNDPRAPTVSHAVTNRTLTGLSLYYDTVTCEPFSVSIVSEPARPDTFIEQWPGWTGSNQTRHRDKERDPVYMQATGELSSPAVHPKRSVESHQVTTMEHATPAQGPAGPAIPLQQPPVAVAMETGNSTAPAAAAAAVGHSTQQQQQQASMSTEDMYAYFAGNKQIKQGAKDAFATAMLGHEDEKTRWLAKKAELEGQISDLSTKNSAGMAQQIKLLESLCEKWSDPDQATAAKSVMAEPSFAKWAGQQPAFMDGISVASRRVNEQMAHRDQRIVDLQKQLGEQQAIVASAVAGHREEAVSASMQAWQAARARNAAGPSASFTTPAAAAAAHNSYSAASSSATHQQGNPNTNWQVPRKRRREEESAPSAAMNPREFLQSMINPNASMSFQQCGTRFNGRTQ